MFISAKAILFKLLLSLFFVAASSPEWEALEKSGRWKVLRVQVNNKLAANPRDGETLVWRSKVLMAFGHTEDSYKAAKEAAQLAPQSADAWAQYAGMAGIMAGRANVLKKMSYASECRNAGVRALELNPKNRLALEVMTSYYQQAPGVVGGDKKKAEDCRFLLESVDPEVKTRRMLREAFETKDRVRIEAALKQAMQKHPKAAWPFREAAQFAMTKSEMRPQDAQSYSKSALENDPFNARAYGYLAQAYAAEAKWGEFDAALSGAEKAMPDNPYPHYMAAVWLISASKEPKRAETLLRRYLRHEPEAGAPNWAYARWRLGLALEQQGDKGGALKELKEASKLMPKDEYIAADLKRLGG
ncbi:MAG: hypothetical protein LBB40_01700 [Holophagales bacterium]|nr:hypothetical protein [Holophagales bacterium]